MVQRSFLAIGKDSCNKYRFFTVTIVTMCLLLSIVPKRHALFSVPSRDKMTEFEDIGGDSRPTEWSPYIEILPEQEALLNPPLLDILETVSVKHSQLYIIDRKDVYMVGEEIRVRINMFNGRGRSLQRGGDLLRVRIFENSLKAAASGYIVDHKNGSYTATVRALWEGSPSIVVYLAYTREAIRALYHSRNELISTRPFTAKFKLGRRVKETPCHAFSSKLSNDTDVCDFTGKNDNMSWFCAKPRDPRVTCDRLSSFQVYTSVSSFPITEAEYLTLERNDEQLQPSFNVNFKGKKPTDTYLRPMCVNFDRKKLWTMQPPVGYFYNNTWNILHCQPPNKENLGKLLRNKKIVLLGDSTTRQWYFDIAERFKCLHFHTNTNKDKNIDKICYDEALNLTVEWIPHSYPGNVNYGRVAVQSIAGYMARHMTEINTVFVIHMFSHLTAVHHSVFRDRMAQVRKSIEKVLEHNENAYILVKGPATFKGKTHTSDYFGLLFRVIMLEEFEGLLDRIVYLDYRDMTIAKQVHDIHPPKKFVTEMVNQMFAYLSD